MFITKKNLKVLQAKRALEAKQRLLDASKNSQETLFEFYQSSYQGHTKASKEIMEEQFGNNIITHNSSNTISKQLFNAFINPFSIVLIILSIISYITDVMLAAPQERDYSSITIVLLLVLISGTLHFFQESRSNNAAAKLSEMVKTTIAVERKDVGKREISIKDIVVGDLVHLASGDMIPADIRILSAKDLFISQSSLTGESEPVEKFAQINLEESNDLLEKQNLAFFGTNVVSGSAVAIVICVGNDTMFGSIAHSLSSQRQLTTFEQGIRSVSWVLIRFMLIMVPIVFFINGFTKKDWFHSFLFALSIAVGLTPEMLPMIISANLSKSALAMSKKRVIIKNLHAIQNLGAMDILCTDKTGTITQDKVVLEYSLDVTGNEDKRVLRHAFLNSYHQTGLKNLMDIAIINHAGEHDMISLVEDYKKIDEIPFDFNRRRMSVLVKDKAGKTQLITKGAIEEMLAISSFVEYHGTIQILTDELKTEVLARVKEYNSKGLRVLGISQKTNPSMHECFGVQDEVEMVLIGYLAFLDPPKPSTSGAILALSEYGVGMKVLTGDNDAVTKSVCHQVGLPIDNILLGSDIADFNDEELREVVETTTVFAKLSPQQKVRIVKALRSNGHTVGFMGDGINDAAAMKASDVGISVDSAVDIAKESADIILLEKDLMVLEAGVIEGRKTYANIIKYIKMTASSNFGNMFSVMIASAFLPFLPMLPIQLLILNLIYEISCIMIPWDNVDADYLKKPRSWDASSIVKFMVWIGPVSSIFDVITYILLFFVICPMVFGGSFSNLSQELQLGFVALFHAGWFVESLWSQTLVIHMIRTEKVPFIQSRASWQLIFMTTLGIVVGTIIPYTTFGTILEMVPMPWSYFPFLIVTIFCYMLLATLLKNLYIKKYGELL